MKHILTLAFALLLLSFSARCARAESWQDYATRLAAKGAQDVDIRAAMKRPVVTVSTNAVPARVRTVEEKAILTALVAQGLTAAQIKAAPDRDKLLDDTLRTKLTTGTAAQQAVAVRQAMDILLMRDAIRRQGRALPSESADEPQPPVVTRTEGLPWYIANGQELPNYEQIRLHLGQP